MDRLELGYDILREVNPKLIYCAISGFGQDGPWLHRPAYDQIIQGASGLMSITGDAQSAPLRAGYPIADTIGGLTAALAISGALNAPQRGTFIDVSMLEATIATMGWAVSNYLIGGIEPTANGNENLTSAPSGTFETADSPLNIAANKDEQWEAMARHLGREELLTQPEYATREDRKANRAALKTDLEKTLRTRSARNWARELNEIGVPAGAVFSVPEILAHPQIADRGMLATFSDTPDVGREITLVRTGFKIDGAAPDVSTPPPSLGQHNDEIYRSLGIDEESLAKLKKERTL
jgi:formyl-CoA transferase